MEVREILVDEKERYYLAIGGIVFGRELSDCDVDYVLNVLRECESKFKDAVPVLVDANYVVSVNQLVVATVQAVRAWLRGKARAKKFGIELLLWIGARKQIRDVVDVLGVHRGLLRAYLLCVSRSLEICKLACEAVLRKLSAVVELNIVEPSRVLSEVLSNGGSIELLRKWFNVGDRELAATLGSEIEKLEKCILSRIALLASE
ncbi:MAG: hypothetical protein DRJ40_01415 [Thermoprotei archaeon]|nr:MAG: hypothetical protein DRJ40_01415 [Thermoprotei archaeon]